MTEIWLRHEESGTEIGMNGDGELFIGNKDSGGNYPDTPEGRERLIKDFRRYTRCREVEVDNNGKPLRVTARNNKNIMEQLIKEAEYAQRSHSRDLLLETFGKAKMARQMEAISKDEFMEINHMTIYYINTHARELEN